jgi:hypothetical protein
MKSKKINEGNVYNVETTFGASQDASKDGLASWKQEMRKQLMDYLSRSKVQNIDAVIKATFGNILD